MKRAFRVAMRTIMTLRYRVWMARRRWGLSQFRDVWNNQYKAGDWDHLNSLAEVDHYSIVGGYIRHFCRQADILDVGCGAGRLLTLLHPECFRRYTGIDHSRQAIDRAKQLNIANSCFIIEDFEEWTPADLADVIVFNESLYHSHDPCALIRRYVPTLKKGGRIIVSIYGRPKTHILWRELDATLRSVHGVQLESDRGQKWVVRIFERDSGTRADL